MTTEQTPSPTAPPGEGVTSALGIERWTFSAWVSPGVNADQPVLETFLRRVIDRNRQAAAAAGWWTSPNPGGTTVEMVPGWRVTVGGGSPFVDYTLATLMRPEDDQPDRDRPDVFQAMMEFRIVRRDGLDQLAAEVAPQFGDDPARAFIFLTEALGVA